MIMQASRFALRVLDPDCRFPACGCEFLDDITRPLDLTAFGEDGQEVEVWTLADGRQAGEPDVANSFADPERIRVRSSRFRTSGTRFDYRFPALSLTVLRWQVKPGRKPAGPRR